MSGFAQLANFKVIGVRLFMVVVRLLFGFCAGFYGRGFLGKAGVLGITGVGFVVTGTGLGFTGVGRGIYGRRVGFYGRAVRVYGRVPPNICLNLKNTWKKLRKP